MIKPENIVHVDLKNTVAPRDSGEMSRPFDRVTTRRVTIGGAANLPIVSCPKDAEECFMDGYDLVLCIDVPRAIYVTNYADAVEFFKGEIK